MKKDPYELENLASDPDMVGVVSQLEAKAATPGPGRARPAGESRDRSDSGAVQGPGRVR